MTTIEHDCVLPRSAHIGDEWTCPDCGREYIAKGQAADVFFQWVAND